MKKNMLLTMERLQLDDGIRSLIRQMWKHGYRTLHSCSGNHKDKNELGYVSFLANSGDGWFERNAEKFGFITKEKDACCYVSSVELILNYQSGRFRGWSRYCSECGAGVGGVRIYRKIDSSDTHRVFNL